ncbi:NADPH oxidase 5-like [Dendronephthya gigantea]|uniref:NADPH oxidase 5-like n=1 Tax=Dendronephthya gigantea TaxID=151771 RepID=UPI00106A8110|nr:NADPH oxidase 5-like [Dendronephthya gigantea]
MKDEKENNVTIAMDKYDRRPSAWFRDSFGLLGKYGKISKDQFIRASGDIGDFSSKLYAMFDAKDLGYVQVQEIVGSLRLLSQRTKTNNGKGNTKPLKWLSNRLENLSDANGNIDAEKFKEELRQPQFIENIFKLMDVNNEGEISLSQIVAAMDRLECSTADSKWYEWIEEKFSVDSNESRLITLEQFKKGLHIEKSFFAERFFSLFKADSTNEDDSISMRDLCQGLELLTNGSQIDKLQFLFKVYDIDGNGELDRGEMRTVLESCVEESSLSMDHQQLEELTEVLFEESDTERKGFITFDELRNFLDKFPGIAENLTISAGKWLTPPTKPKKKPISRYIPKYFTWNYISNNPDRVGFIFVYLLINAALMIWVGIVRAPMGVFVVLARIHGMCLNLNCTFVLVLMLKLCLTWVRTTWFRNVLPIDDHIMFHKLVGFFIAYLSFGHTIGHLGFYISTPEINGTQIAVWEYLFTTKAGQGWFHGSAGITGLILLLILIVMVICSQPFVRNKGYFELFYWTHHLFIAFWVLIILHAPNFWKWIIVPGVLYIIERVIRLRWFNLARYGPTYIEEGITMPSKVTHLVITRPPNFKYKPGDYVHINIPAIAQNEWHPFTISSSPEQEDVLWVHVRGVGTWTKKLYDYFEEDIMEEGRHRLVNNSVAIRRERTFRIKDKKRHKQDDIGTENEGAEADDENRNGDVVEQEKSSTVVRQPVRQRRKKLRIYVDGPYGAPSVHIFEAEHAVLIAGGIGVTPFASILQSIMKKVQNATIDCPNCEHKWVGMIPEGLQKLKKVDFFWINRCQRSFEWFLSLLNELEVEQCCQRLTKSFLDMHIHMTSALKKDDMKGIGLQLALDLMHAKKSVDMITGLRTKTSPGRPNWDTVFEKISKEKRGKVTVFFCGAPVMGKVIKIYCRKYGFGFRKENF